MQHTTHIFWGWKVSFNRGIAPKVYFLFHHPRCLHPPILCFQSGWGPKCADGSGPLPSEFRQAVGGADLLPGCRLWGFAGLPRSNESEPGFHQAASQPQTRHAGSIHTHTQDWYQCPLIFIAYVSNWLQSGMQSLMPTKMSLPRNYCNISHHILTSYHTFQISCHMLALHDNTVVSFPALINFSTPKNYSSQPLVDTCSVIILLSLIPF